MSLALIFKMTRHRGSTSTQHHVLSIPREEIQGYLTQFPSQLLHHITHIQTHTSNQPKLNKTMTNKFNKYQYTPTTHNPTTTPKLHSNKHYIPYSFNNKLLTLTPQTNYLYNHHNNKPIFSHPFNTLQSFSQTSITQTLTTQF